VSEFGDPDEPGDFAVLLSWSPYHRAVDGRRYPSVLIEASDEDARTDAWHARKLAARLQTATNDPESRPILLRTERIGGHNAGQQSSKQVEDLVDQTAFLWWQLGMAPPAALQPLDFRPRRRR
jgi:prolyl oligopeptidase